MRHVIYPALALAMAALPAAARPLDVLACDTARQELAAMTDVPPLLERGPEWAKANASPQALQRISRWIELGEILSFRCGRGMVSAEARRAAAAADLIENPPPEPATPDAAKLNSLPEAAAAAPPAAAPAQAPPPTPKKTKAKSKPKPAADSASAEPTAAPKPDAADHPPPRKRKPKPAAADTASPQPPAAPAQ